MNEHKKSKIELFVQRIYKLPLEIKILLLILTCLILGFGTYVIYFLNSETRALKNQYKLRSNLFSETLVSGIKNIMLSGRAPYVRAFIEEARDQFNEVGKIQLFNNEAEEIFPAINPHIAIPIKDSEIIEKLINRQYSNNIYPLKNEASCITCHSDGSDIRGFVKLDFVENSNWKEAILEVVNNAFQTIMISGKGEFADTLLLDVNNFLGLNLIQVYDEYASYVAFGKDNVEVDERILENILDAIHKDNDYKSFRSIENFYFSPMPNIESCNTCHGTDSKLRGILAMEIGAKEEISRDQVINSVIIGLKNLMRLQKASYSGAYIDEIRNLEYVKNFQVFDNGKISNEGYRELWVPNPEYNIILKDSTVADLITKNNFNIESSPNKLEFIDEIMQIDHLTQMLPIMNDVNCQACHKEPNVSSSLYESQKDKWKVRSIVKVSTSMKDIKEEIQKNMIASIIVGIITLIFMTLLLRIFMRKTILIPLDIIGKVANKIGIGDLSVKAEVKSQDEIGLLATRINSMIKGLQERLHLTKFVSDEAVTAVKKAGLEGLSLGGERKETTILETDIRGFTSMSEKMEPEQVVSMLNTYLDKQTEIIQNYSGDIDKFIGDAVLAVFTGEKMAENAVNCAINIQNKIKKLNKKLNKDIMIGIGINTGPVVMGAMGSKERMDFTVIGDNVNLSARLCDAAKPGEIIISKHTEKCLPKNKFNLKKITAIKVKGKKKPIEIFQVIFK